MTRRKLATGVLAALLALGLTACPEEDPIEDPIEEDPVENDVDNDVLDEDEDNDLLDDDDNGS
jgi:hypothetical protein